MDIKHTIRISNNITKLQVIGDSEYDNALQSTLISVELGDNCKELGPSCFINCKNLEYVKMPKTCRVIGEYAFYGCENLKYVTCIDKNDCYPVFEYGAHAFDGCNSLTEVNYMLSYDKNTNEASRDVTIGPYCFANCNSLTSVTQKNWSFMGSHMFAGCEKLTQINLINQTNYVQSYALADIPNLKTITIPSNIWFFSEGMFENDVSLSSIQIIDTDSSPSKFGNVDDCAFAGCTSISSIVLPRSIIDLSACSENMLSGSNISSVTFSGIPDNKFVTTGGRTVTLVDGYIQDKTEFLSIVDLAIEHNVPLVIFTNRHGINEDQGSCGYCKTLASHLRSSQWKEFMEQNADKCIFVYAKSWRSTVEGKFSSKNIKIPWNNTSMFAKAACVWCKTDGTISTIQTNPDGYNWGNKGDPSTLIKNVKNFIEGSDPNGAMYVLNEKVVNQSITKFGSPLPQVTFISKEGTPHIFTKDNVIQTIPNTIVDKVTKDNFRYGTWYYNAEELRAYADEYGIPVLCEYSKDGCYPCGYFRRNIFKNLEFQSWVMSSPYLFCRIEVKDDDAFSNQFKDPEAYYIDQVWAKEIDPNVRKLSIPIFFWYWKKNGMMMSYALSSYHFNPDATKGDQPPFSMQQLINDTESRFGQYRQLSSTDFARYETYDLYSGDANRTLPIGKYAVNVPGDTEGIMFPCDEKTAVERYDIVNLWISGYSPVNSLLSGGEVQYEPATYYVNDTDNTIQNEAPTRYGVIFKVEKNGDKNYISYLLETENYANVDEKRKYAYNTWYNLSTDAGIDIFNGIIDEAEANDSYVVIIKSENGEGKNIDDLKICVDFDDLLSTAYSTYFIEVRNQTDDWGSGIGKALKDFITNKYRQGYSDGPAILCSDSYTSEKWYQDLNSARVNKDLQYVDEDGKLLPHFNSWTSTVPKIYVSQRCIGCTVLGNKVPPQLAAEIDTVGKDIAQIVKEIRNVLNRVEN